MIDQARRAGIEKEVGDLANQGRDRAGVRVRDAKIDFTIGAVGIHEVELGVVGGKPAGRRPLAIGTDSSPRRRSRRLSRSPCSRSALVSGASAMVRTGSTSGRFFSGITRRRPPAAVKISMSGMGTFASPGMA